MGGSAPCIVQWCGGGHIRRPIKTSRGVGVIAGAKSDPGILKAESARRARAQTAPSGRFLAVKCGGSAGNKVWNSFLSLSRKRKKEKGEIHFVA